LKPRFGRLLGAWNLGRAGGKRQPGLMVGADISHFRYFHLISFPPFLLSLLLTIIPKTVGAVLTVEQAPPST
jgi:hypothetical protein